MANGERRTANGEVTECADAAHSAQLTVWHVPSAIGSGERFRVSVGARCSAGCNLGGRELNLLDQGGSQVGTVRLSDQICPGTEALYFAEVEAQAPLAAGSHQWEAKMDGWDAKVPHAAASFPMTVRVVAAPECEVTVKAVDRETQAPIKGARIVMHPYRAVTDDSGIAKVRVAKGQYDILVSGHRYLQACASVEVTADMSTSAELDADQPEELLE